MVALYAFGSNSSGQLAVGHQEDASSPTRSIQPTTGPSTPVVKIAAGGNHTLVLFESGELLASGANGNGQCLRKLSSARTTCGEFQLVDFNDSSLERVFLCSATWEASAVVLSDGRVLSAGSGSRGELGLGNDITLSKEATIIPGFPPPAIQVVDLAASMSHTVAVLSNGEVWGWGSGRKGQLGVPAVNSWSPRKIEEVKFHAVRAACGKDHTFIIGPPESGETLILGTDRFGLKAEGPFTIPGWKDIASSWGSIFILLDNGNIVAWGRNDHKQLPPPDLPKVKQLAVGSEHALALTEQGSVIAWGWGEHGNCGVAPENSQNDFGLTKIDTLSGVTGLGAGCATSWIVVDDSNPC
jgi:protein ATS1